ncbi:MAG: NAD(P)H-dependent flavin oxidoreductase [Bacteroidia bacterium]
MNTNRIKELFQIKYPIVQGGMVWCSGWRLASAVSNAGGLGLIGSGSMNPDLLKEHIQKCKAATSNPFGVNVPLLYPHAEQHIQTIIEEKVPIVFTSAGNPSLYTSILKSYGIKVVHVIANTKFALKAIEAGVDALVAEGFEAGGHNGKEETTTFCLIPQIKEICKIPLIAAGGIATGAGIVAAQALGADGVQIGSGFAVCEESSAHPFFKQKVIEAKEGDTELTLKKLTPVRMLKNELYQRLNEAIQQNSSPEQLREILGKGRAKRGILEGDLIEGELEIGQISALLKDIKPVHVYIDELIEQYQIAKERIINIQ